jgi:pullulanase/glycogen debranching enzyme
MTWTNWMQRLLVTLGCALAPWATAQPRSACDAAEASVVLRAEATPSDARAVAFDALHLRWPGVEASGRFRLLHSLNARLRAGVGQRAGGFDAALPLTVARQLPAVAQRFGWVGSGVDLVLRPADRTRLRSLLRGQLLLVQEDATGRVQRVTRVQTAAALDDLYAAAEATSAALGATPGDAGTRFRLWAPTAQRVALCLYDGGRSHGNVASPLSLTPRGGAGGAKPIPGGRSQAAERLAMQRDAATGVWSTQDPRDLSGRYYSYLVEVVAPGAGLVRNRVTDPYSLSLNADSQRSFVARLDAPALKPPGWDGHARPAPLAASTEMVIYELHLRDFSIGDATVPAEQRGKYLAFTASDSNGMRHLKRLVEAGLTDVHLLPVFDFASVPESGCITPEVDGPVDGPNPQAQVTSGAAADCYNWGYDPWHFAAPEGSYASDADDGARRVIEFRHMVQSLHGAGLRVGMDVVYNHTSASGQAPKSVLDRIVPGYYQRLDAAGAVEHSTCCENTATEHRMMARLMMDTAVVWARQHGIDSFRFDLMGHQPRAAMESLRRSVEAATGRRVDLIGEGWNFGEVADSRRFVQASQLSLNGSGIGTFSDRGRDAVRGGGAADNGVDQILNQGYINGLSYDPNRQAVGRATREDLLRAADMVRVGLAGSQRGYVLQTAFGQSLPLERLVYGGNQPAGYASQPAEVVNYVENHDNQTLFDANAFKLPSTTSREDRARVQHLGSAIVAFSQGIAYFHAGQELLRSKSMDRNSFDSGDHFNRLDYSLADNGFGVGLPPQASNGASWPLMQPLLADAASIKPDSELIRWTRDAFVDLLRIRASSSLFRLRTSADVQARLHFHNVGPAQEPTVLVAQLDGRGYPGAGFSELVYLVNVDKAAHTLDIDALKDKAYRLHPVHRGNAAADRRAAQASYAPATGSFMVPARTAVVFTLP